MKIKLIIVYSLIKKRLLFAIMKTFILLLCTTVFSFNVENSFSQEKVMIDQDQLVTVDQVFKIIKQQTDYRFIYPKKLFKDIPRVQLKKGEVLVTKLLELSLGNNHLNFELFNNNTIIIKERPIAIPVLIEEETQGVQISGTITDVSGQPLPGTNILEKGTNNGVSSDFDGKYSINVSGQSATLVFSYIGFTTQEIVVNNQTTINVVLAEDASQIDEIVITALGIKRSEKTLSYAQQTVKGDDLTSTREANIVSSLSGRAAGVEIKKSSSGVGGSTKVLIRGNKSLSGDGSPLFVIDGIPMVNNRGTQPDLWQGVDQGDGLSQINPDDIESMSVLKGANAAILYGSQGANGVIVITTKSGKQGAAVVNVKSGVTFESIIEGVDLQYRYGTDSPGRQNWSTVAGDYDDTYVDDFFNTGASYFNSVSVSGGNEKTQAYFSYANTTSSGVTPGNEYSKNNFNFKQSTKFFNDKLKVTSNVILAQEGVDDRARSGFIQNPIVALYMFPRNQDFDDYKTNYSQFDETRRLNVHRWAVEGDAWLTNPYWIQNENSYEDKTNRLISSLNLEYDITEQLKLQVRGNYDYAVKSHEGIRRAGGNESHVSPNGWWDYQKYDDTSTYLDGILTYNNTFADFSVTALAGATYQNAVLGQGVSVKPPGGGDDQLFYANEFYFGNLIETVQVNSTLNSRVEKQSVFANATIGFKEMLFLDLAGRNDWASTLALTGNDSYFYPSAGLTAIISEMADMPDFISFAKIRGSYAQIANEVPFNVVSQHNTITNTGNVSLNTLRPFTDAKPEQITTTELGLDLRLFQNRLGLDLTYYDIKSEDQFIRLDRNFEGYTGLFVNAGLITNKGVEVTLTGKPVVTEDFTWSTAINYAINENKIVEIHEDITAINQGSNQGFRLELREGGSVGAMYVDQFVRDDQGRLQLTGAVGDRKFVETQLQEYIGNAEADYTLGWSNTVNYKDFGLNMQINGKFGGVVGSSSLSILDGWGHTETTAAARDLGYVTVDAVHQDTGEVITQMQPEEYFTAVGGPGRGGVKEAYVYDRTNVRISQLALSYKINTEKFDWLKNASLSLIGNNLLFLYKDAPFDPELTVGTGRVAPGVNNFNLPSTRSYGLNLSLTF